MDKISFFEVLSLSGVLSDPNREASLSPSQASAHEMPFAPEAVPAFSGSPIRPMDHEKELPSALSPPPASRKLEERISINSPEVPLFKQSQSPI